jgi:hypothetical protein
MRPLRITYWIDHNQRIVGSLDFNVDPTAELGGLMAHVRDHQALYDCRPMRVGTNDPMPTYLITFYWNGRPLEDEDTLSTLGVGNDCNSYLEARWPGQNFIQIRFS